MHPTRRELIAGGAVGVTVLGAGFAPPPAIADDPLAGVRGDTELLGRLVAIEQLIEFAYAHLLRSAGVSSTTGRVLATFLAHEQEHVRILSSALVGRRAAAPPAPTDVTVASGQLAKLGAGGSLRDSRGDSGSVRYLIGVETLAEGTYYSAMSKLSNPELLDRAAQIMSCEAQHWTALSGLQHAGDVTLGVPYPTVTG
jgi:Ferritin-like domain